MAESYGSLTVQKLKQELVRRKAATTGRKTDLVERLKAYDGNDDFRGTIIQLPGPLDERWPSSGFTQLLPKHQDMLPPISKELTEGYFIFRMAEDHQTVNDLKAMEKGARMFSANRVLTCSVYFEGSSAYFCGIVGASMKNKVSYNYRVKVDKTGAPVISHCECPAGKGPHATCKHIAAVLLMAEHFIAIGSLHVEKSCTENLQTFHRPKSTYKGSPVKAEALPSKRKWSDKMLEDPRPAKYRKMVGFNDHVRNMMVNYCSTTSQAIALRHLHPKADLQTGVKDHDYFEKPFPEYWVDRAVQVTEDEAIQLENSTQDQGSSQRWHRERKWRLTASRFGEVTKMTSRRNKDKLCHSLLHSHTCSRSMIHGKQYEKKSYFTI